MSWSNSQLRLGRPQCCEQHRGVCHASDATFPTCDIVPQSPASTSIPPYLRLFIQSLSHVVRPGVCVWPQRARMRIVPRQASAVNLSSRVSTAELARLRAEVEALRADNQRLAAEADAARVNASAGGSAQDLTAHPGSTDPTAGLASDGQVCLFILVNIDYHHC